CTEKTAPSLLGGQQKDWLTQSDLALPLPFCWRKHEASREGLFERSSNSPCCRVRSPRLLPFIPPSKDGADNSGEEFLCRNLSNRVPSSLRTKREADL